MQIASGAGTVLQKDFAPPRQISILEEMERSTRDDRNYKNGAVYV